MIFKLMEVVVLELSETNAFDTSPSVVVLCYTLKLRAEVHFGVLHLREMY